jgi:hypothetical protein
MVDVELGLVRKETKLTDPSGGMKSFQHELRRGGTAIHATRTDPNLFIRRDAPNGPPEHRFVTYPASPVEHWLFSSGPSWSGCWFEPIRPGTLECQTCNRSGVCFGRANPVVPCAYTEFSL